MRVLLTCQPVPGHLHPNLAVAQSLRARGHRVAVYTGSQAARALQHEELTWYPFQPRMDALVTRNILPAEGASAAAKTSTDVRGYFRVKELNEALIDWLLRSIPWQVEDLTEAVQDFRPDVLITDITLLGPLLVLRETLSIPVGVFSVLSACSIPGPQAPTWGRGLPSPKTASTRLMSRLEDQFLWWLLRDFRNEASRLRGAYGLAPLSGRVADEYARASLFMVATTRAFDYQRTDLPACVEYVGPCSWNGNTQETPVPQWLSELPRDIPVVHVTEGTIHTREPMVLRAAAEGLSNRRMHVVMTTGRHRTIDSLSLPSMGDNVRVEQFVPHHALFPRTDVVVTTGGAGTVNTALLAGVPLVVVPTGWDLPENAQRVVECGAGLRLSPRRCTPKRLRESVEEVLGDSKYRMNAKRIGEALRREGGAEKAAALIERLAGRHPAANWSLAGRSA